jgi:hypothetical protein
MSDGFQYLPRESSPADPEGNEFCVIHSDSPSGLRLATVVLDSDDPQRVGRFWGTALERELVQVEPEKDYWLPGDPPLTFVKVPEGKSTKNRVHLDWYAPDREAEVERLIALGATRLWDVKNEDFEWTTLPTSRATSSAWCSLSTPELHLQSSESAGVRCANGVTLPMKATTRENVRIFFAHPS